MDGLSVFTSLRAFFLIATLFQIIFTPVAYSESNLPSNLLWRSKLAARADLDTNLPRRDRMKAILTHYPHLTGLLQEITQDIDQTKILIKNPAEQIETYEKGLGFKRFFISHSNEIKGLDLNLAQLQKQKTYLEKDREFLRKQSKAYEKEIIEYDAQLKKENQKAIKRNPGTRAYYENCLAPSQRRYNTWLRRFTSVLNKVWNKVFTKKVVHSEVDLLIFAAHLGMKDLVSELIKQGVNLDGLSKDLYGLTALSAAIQGGQYEIANMLIAAGAQTGDPAHRSDFDARKIRQEDIFGALRFGIPFDATAGFNANKGALDPFTLVGKKMNPRFNLGNSVTTQTNPEFIKLISQIIKNMPAHQRLDQEEIEIWANKKGHREILESLFQKQSRRESRSLYELKYEALQKAAATLDVERVKTLLAMEAPLNPGDSNGELPPLIQTLLAASRSFLLADIQKAEAIVGLFVENGADLQQPYGIDIKHSWEIPNVSHPYQPWAPGNHLSPLMMAILTGSRKITNMVLNSLPDTSLNYANEQGESAVSVAALRKRHDVLKKLFVRKASPTVPPGNFETPLMLALDHGLVDQDDTLGTVRMLTQQLKGQSAELNRTFQSSYSDHVGDSSNAGNPEYQPKMPQTALDRAINLSPTVLGLNDSEDENMERFQLQLKSTLIDTIVAAGGRGAPKEKWAGTSEEENTYRTRLGLGLKQPLTRRRVAEAYIALEKLAVQALTKRDKIASQRWQTPASQAAADEEFYAFCDKYNLTHYRPLQELVEANSILQSISE